MGFYTVSNAIHIRAPIDRCFLLSTNIDLVSRIFGMRPLSDQNTGFLQPDGQLIWYGWKFGLPQIHESLITAYDRPRHFQDTMGRGRFSRFQQDHHFSEIDGHTLLQNKIRFSPPLGPLGAFLAKQVLVPHITGLVRERLHLLRQIAESDEWQYFLPAETAETPLPAQTPVNA